MDQTELLCVYMKAAFTSIKGIPATSLSSLHKSVSDFTAFQAQQTIQLEIRLVCFFFNHYFIP